MKPAPIKSRTDIADLDKFDIRAGTRQAVEHAASSCKLFKLTVDFGDHRRTILAGIRQKRDDPGEFTGLQALFVVNLPPRELAGEVSGGMLSDIGHADGVTPVPAVTEGRVPDGSRAG